MQDLELYLEGSELLEDGTEEFKVFLVLDQELVPVFRLVEDEKSKEEIKLTFLPEDKLVLGSYFLLLVLGICFFVDCLTEILDVLDRHF